MVLPVPFPKIRRGSPLRLAMTVTAVGLVVALVSLQFRLAPGSLLYEVAYGATVAAGLGILAYYLVGPFTVHEPPPKVQPQAAP
jgi:hypothetical protein